jgi:hypothetical protein
MQEKTKRHVGTSESRQSRSGQGWVVRGSRRSEWGARERLGLELVTLKSWTSCYRHVAGVWHGNIEDALRKQNARGLLKTSNDSFWISIRPSITASLVHRHGRLFSDDSIVSRHCDGAWQRASGLCIARPLDQWQPERPRQQFGLVDQGSQGPQLPVLQPSLYFFLPRPSSGSLHQAQGECPPALSLLPTTY